MLCLLWTNMTASSYTRLKADLCTNPVDPFARCRSNFLGIQSRTEYRERLSYTVFKVDKSRDKASSSPNSPHCVSIDIASRFRRVFSRPSALLASVVCASGLVFFSSIARGIIIPRQVSRIEPLRLYVHANRVYDRCTY